MARSWSNCRLFGQLCLISILGLAYSQSEGQAPKNVTVTPGTDFLEVEWVAPNVTNLSQNLESYRVRVFPSNSEDQKRVQWVPPDGTLQQTISCLKPGTLYNVQVFARYHKGKNLTDGGSEVEQQSTLPATTDSFLATLQENWEYIAVGAALMAFVFLVFTPFIWCCCCRNSCTGKTGQMELGDEAGQGGRGKGKKKKSRDENLPPSAKELQEREMARLPSSSNRYTAMPNSIQGMSFQSHTSESTINSQSTLVHPGRSASLPYEPAPTRPPLPTWAQHGESSVAADEVFESDPPDYENSMPFGPGAEEGELYSNQAFFPVQPAQEHPVYGNCQF